MLKAYVIMLKNRVILLTKHVNLSVNVMFNACFFFFFFLSLSFCPHTHGLILFKGYAVTFKMWVICLCSM